MRPRQEPGGSRAEASFLRLLAIAVVLGVLLLFALGAYALLRIAVPRGPTLPDAPTVMLETAGPGTPLVSETVAPTETPSPTLGSPTMDIGATATAACSEFEGQFPGTPCPSMPLIGTGATATAACEQFSSQFPGTPCP